MRLPTWMSQKVSPSFYSIEKRACPNPSLTGEHRQSANPMTNNNFVQLSNNQIGLATYSYYYVDSDETSGVSTLCLLSVRKMVSMDNKVSRSE